VLEHLADEQKALQEWGRVLRPAVVVVFVPAFMFLWTAPRRGQPALSTLSPGRAVRGAAGRWLCRGTQLLLERLPVSADCRHARPAEAASERAPVGRRGDLFKPPAAVNALLTHLLLGENGSWRRVQLAVWCERHGPGAKASGQGRARQERLTRARPAWGSGERLVLADQLNGPRSGHGTRTSVRRTVGTSDAFENFRRVGRVQGPCGLEPACRFMGSESALSFLQSGDRAD